ncbi:MAG TPA: hypothetical protein VGM02_05075 [Acidobacteriaceae bacterium]|jgi:hypothetical protein
MYPQCRHVHPNGESCHAAALKGSHWCYFHNRLHERYRSQQARHRLHSQRDASGRFTPTPSSDTALVPASDYGIIPVGAPSGCHPERSEGSAVSSHSPLNTPFSLPPIEDSASVQLALAEVLEALAADQIDAKRAGLLLYGLQVASANAKHVHLHRSSIQSVSYTADGIALAPQEYGWDVEDIEDEDDQEDEDEDEESAD